MRVVLKMFNITKTELIAHLRSDWAVKVSTKEQAKNLVPYLKNTGRPWWVIWELIKRGTCFYFDENGDLVKTISPPPERTIVEFKKIKIKE